MSRQKYDCEMTYKVVTQEKQTIFDMVIQEYGDMRMLPVLLFDNPTYDPETFFTRGTQFTFRDDLPPTAEVNAEQFDYFRRKAMTIKTGA